MRSFIVTNPNLSVGRPGDIVTSSQLQMTDEKLDEWVKAGYGTELHRAIPEQIEDVVSAEATDVTGGPDDEFDPGDWTVPQVLEYVDRNPDMADVVLAREVAGRNRGGIVEALDTV